METIGLLGMLLFALPVNKCQIAFIPHFIHIQVLSLSLDIKKVAKLTLRRSNTVVKQALCVMCLLILGDYSLHHTQLLIIVSRNSSVMEYYSEPGHVTWSSAASTDTALKADRMSPVAGVGLQRKGCFSFVCCRGPQRFRLDIWNSALKTRCSYNYECVYY